ncbi:hypothetical protein TIFTF001_019289 [Ficus carica]|uniref:Uncharacterized protein n=1 Tax=Ficus carica TaxID=3494 RepID=A0AA88DCJ0_FICCA|nr:hypothetical protein TIFTF001_019289 [Ficus carica]
MAITLPKGNMSLALGIYFLFILSFFFSSSEFVCRVRGRALSTSPASGVRGRRLVRGAAFWSSSTFNVRSFGALADGETDDSQSVKFVGVNNTIVQGISSINSKFFHMALVGCHNFRGTKIEIKAPEDSPNTDGIHVERSSRVYLSRSHIGTGDDCISIGQGNSQITITSIHCGPGHGISVGSLGKYRNEEDVSGLVVRNCYMKGTTNGIRIKTWANSPGSSAATNMTFANIVMNNVSNPIIIDQSYCPSSSCSSKAPSRVKLSDINFKNIRGTSSSEVAVNLECSRGIPCQNVYLEDVHLDLSSGNKSSTSFCSNVRAKFIGTQIPPPCS